MAPRPPDDPLGHPGDHVPPPQHGELAAIERVVQVSGVAAYEPGAFFRRELPYRTERAAII